MLNAAAAALLDLRNLFIFVCTDFTLDERHGGNGFPTKLGALVMLKLHRPTRLNEDRMRWLSSLLAVPGAIKFSVLQSVLHYTTIYSV